MNLETKPETRILLGSGKRFSPDTLVALRRAVTSRSPALDWAKGQLVVAAFSVLLLAAGVVGVLKLAFPGLGAGAGDPQGGPTEAVAEMQDAADGGTRPVAAPRLRDDLFRIPVVERPVVRQEPKVNPVQLLRQIELQGVIGGGSPRAMVLYKNTNETVTVSAGDDLGEFQVVEIKERSVVLKWRDETFELSL